MANKISCLLSQTPRQSRELRQAMERERAAAAKANFRRGFLWTIPASFLLWACIIFVYRLLA